MSESYLSFAEASRRCGRAPRTVSVLIYSGRLDASDWPTVAGRTVVPASALPEIRRVLAGGRRREEAAVK